MIYINLIAWFIYVLFAIFQIIKILVTFLAWPTSVVEIICVSVVFDILIIYFFKKSFQLKLFRFKLSVLQVSLIIFACLLFSSIGTHNSDDVLYVNLARFYKYNNINIKFEDYIGYAWNIDYLTEYKYSAYEALVAAISNIFQIELLNVYFFIMPVTSAFLFVIMVAFYYDFALIISKKNHISFLLYLLVVISLYMLLTNSHYSIGSVTLQRLHQGKSIGFYIVSSLIFLIFIGRYKLYLKSVLVLFLIILSSAYSINAILLPMVLLVLSASDFLYKRNRNKSVSSLTYYALSFLMILWQLHSKVDFMESVAVGLVMAFVIYNLKDNHYLDRIAGVSFYYIIIVYFCVLPFINLIGLSDIYWRLVILTPIWILSPLVISLAVVNNWRILVLCTIFTLALSVVTLTDRFEFFKWHVNEYDKKIHSFIKESADKNTILIAPEALSSSLSILNDDRLKIPFTRYKYYQLIEASVRNKETVIVNRLLKENFNGCVVSSKSICDELGYNIVIITDVSSCVNDEINKNPYPPYEIHFCKLSQKPK